MSDRGGDFAPLAPLVVAPYLEAYGYQAADADKWRVAPGTAAALAAGVPKMELGVSGHEEADGHTLYVVSCALQDVSVRTEWTARRRLAQLREGLHDRVKPGLGERYLRHFAGAPFALKGGVPGTTARLDSWLRCLASCVNSGSTAPSLAALALYFLEAPEPQKCSELVRSLDAKPPVVGKRTAPPAVRRVGADEAPARETRAAGDCGGSGDDGGLLDGIEVSLDWGADTPGLFGGAVGSRAPADGLVLRFRLPDGTERLVDFGTKRPPLGVDFRKVTPLRVSRSYHFAEALGVRPGWEVLTINGTRVDDWVPTDAFALLKKIVLGDKGLSDAGGDSRRTPSTEARAPLSDGGGAIPWLEPAPNGRRWGRTPPPIESGGGSSPLATPSSTGSSGPAEATSEAPMLESAVLGFELPDGSERAVDFTGYQPPLGLNLRKRVPITIKVITPNSPAESLGVKEGWVVISVNGRSLRDIPDFSGMFALLQETLSGALRGSTRTPA